MHENEHRLRRIEEALRDVRGAIRHTHDHILRDIGELSQKLEILAKLEKTMSELSDAVAELGVKVAADTTVDQSALTLMTGLTALIRDLQAQVAAAADVPAAVAAVKAFGATLQQNQDTLASGVAANTPAAAPV